MRQAIELVKKSLGEDALIFSHRKVAGGVEIEAAIDSSTEANLAPKPNKLEVEKPAKPSFNSNEFEFATITKELADLKHLLQHQLSSIAWKENNSLSPQQIIGLKYLLSKGFNFITARKITETIVNSNCIDEFIQQAQQALQSTLKISSNLEEHESGIIALVGPTGVGKTTSIAKLASRFIMKYGSDQLGLICADAYRIAAQEQLGIYANILKVPMLFANTASQLNEAITNLQDKRLILIDTAGVSLNNNQITERLNLIKSPEHTIKHYLCLGASSQYGFLQQVFDSFKPLGINNCIITKTDDTLEMATCISSILENQMQIAFIGTGQKVPEDLELANASNLIQQALCENPSRFSKDELELKLTGEING